jgi:hypothetical protein
MASGHDIWHNDALFTRATKTRLGARSVGENVALNDDAAGAHARLMASEGHRANVLTARFDAAAVGAVRGDDGRLYVTEVFVERLASAPPAVAAATKGVAAAVPAYAAPSPAPAPGPTSTSAPTTSPSTSIAESAASGQAEELAAGHRLQSTVPTDGGGTLSRMLALAIAFAFVVGVAVAVYRRTLIVLQARPDGVDRWVWRGWVRSGQRFPASAPSR